MFEVRQEATVAAGHQLRLSPDHEERMHGHNWRIVAVLRCRALDSRGMVMDFNRLGDELRRLIVPYEHVALNELAPFDDLNPTAENIARVVADQLGAKLDDSRVRVQRVEVWETDTCAAIYYRDPL